jgi:hypothetical protein
MRAAQTQRSDPCPVRAVLTALAFALALLTPLGVRGQNTDLDRDRGGLPHERGASQRAGIPG